MSELPGDERLLEIRGWLRDELADYRERVRSFAFEERYERMGRIAAWTHTRDGKEVVLRTQVTGGCRPRRGRSGR